MRMNFEGLSSVFSLFFDTRWLSTVEYSRTQEGEEVPGTQLKTKDQKNWKIGQNAQENAKILLKKTKNLNFIGTHKPNRGLVYSFWQQKMKRPATDMQNNSDEKRARTNDDSSNSSFSSSTTTTNTTTTLYEKTMTSILKATRNLAVSRNRSP